MGRFRRLPQHYYRNVHGVALVFDLSDRETFAGVSEWYRELKAKANLSPGVVLVGNKCDLSDKRQISYEEAKGLADELGILYIEASAKDSTNVKEAFELLVALSLTRRVLALPASH
mmetsp:Transcript_13902/g.26078  ORF Transcript_13902/g.26078 Transcript_13902/m.26078 type:complete len:116 (+) Transcript_13902:263-610(+)